MTADTAAKWQAVGAIAQVIVAAIALSLAWKANRLSRGSAFTQHVVSKLFDVLKIARDVKAKYHRLFEPFPEVKSKDLARAEWLRLRETVLGTLQELLQVMPEVQQSLSAWQAVEADEDTHVASDALTVKDSKEALKRYDEEYDRFIAAVSKLMKKELK